MTSSVRKKIGTGVIVLLVTVLTLPAMAAAFGPGGGKPFMGFNGRAPGRSPLGFWQNSQIVQKLGLTAEQIKQVRESYFTFREKRLAVTSELERLRLQMDRAFTQDTIDEAGVLALAEKMSGLKGKLFVQNVESRLALGKLLNAEQIDKLRQYRGNREVRRPEKGQRRISQRPRFQAPDYQPPVAN